MRLLYRIGREMQAWGRSRKRIDNLDLGPKTLHIDWMQSCQFKIICRSQWIYGENQPVDSIVTEL
jgi:hypothetical protein